MKIVNFGSLNIDRVYKVDVSLFQLDELGFGVFVRKRVSGSLGLDLPLRYEASDPNRPSVPTLLTQYYSQRSQLEGFLKISQTRVEALIHRWGIKLGMPGYDSTQISPRILSPVDFEAY